MEVRILGQMIYCLIGFSCSPFWGKGNTTECLRRMPHAGAAQRAWRINDETNL